MTESKPGWTWCPRCQMLTPDFIYEEFCAPMLEVGR